MGRPRNNGTPSFRFNSNEVAEMEALLQKQNIQVPEHVVIVALAEKFSSSTERSGKSMVNVKQVWNWFHNRRHALRSKSAKEPGLLSGSTLPQNESIAVNTFPQYSPQSVTATVRNVHVYPKYATTPSGRTVSENLPSEFEAKSAKDGAWYDVAEFLSYRSLENGDADVLARFSRSGPNEDEWINVSKHVRQRSLPCQSSECVLVTPGDLILCFQDGKDQALYFDAHVLDSQRRRHDARGCRCRFLVRFDHDLSQEIVPLEKVCRRPETDYRLRLLHALDETTKKQAQHVDKAVKHTSIHDDNASNSVDNIVQPKNVEIGVK